MPPILIGLSGRGGTAVKTETALRSLQLKYSLQTPDMLAARRPREGEEVLRNSYSNFTQ